VSEQTLTELQIDLMKVIWERGEATTAEVCEAVAPARGLALSTVATLLSRLEKRNVLAHRKDGRQYVYRALVSRAAVRRSMVEELTRSLFGGDSAALVRHLVAAHEVGPDEMDRIRGLLEESDQRGTAGDD
jgi:predicted transcriptional regulator